MIGNSRLLLQPRPNAEGKETAELLGMIENAVMYMDKIISDLPNFAAPVHPKVEQINTTDVLKETLSAIRISTPLKVSIIVDDSAQMMTADPVLVKRILANLITNTVQAMPNGGDIRILARRDEAECLVSFQDTGVGISTELLPRLFEPFFTIGQGLGLSVCKRLVEAHGDGIIVNSTLGKGSNFTVRLPFVKDLGG